MTRRKKNNSREQPSVDTHKTSNAAYPTQKARPISLFTSNFDIQLIIPWSIVFFLLTFVVGFALYDFWTSTAKIILGVITTVGPIVVGILNIVDLPGIFKRLRPKSKRVKSILLSVSIGLFLGTIAVAIWCGILGNRLEIDNVKNSDSEATGTPTLADNPSEKPIVSNPPQESQPGASITETCPSNSPSPDDSSLGNTVSGDASAGDNTLEGGDATGNGDDSGIKEPTPPLPVENPVSLTVSEDFFMISNASMADTLPTPYLKNKTSWEAFIADTIKALINTNNQPDSEEVNKNADYTSRTGEANRLEEDIRSNGMDYDKLLEIIRLREEALDIFPMGNLQHLLANNYQAKAGVLAKREEWDDAYRAYLRAIQYEVSCIRLLSQLNDIYYAHLYHIAISYVSIGDLDGIAVEGQEEADFIATCLLEIVSRHAFGEDYNSIQYYSCYYAGIANHGLLNILWMSTDRDAYIYFFDAFAYYSKAVEDTRDPKGIYNYLSQLCDWAQIYINKYGPATGMLSKEEYMQLSSEYKDLSR